MKFVLFTIYASHPVASELARNGCEVYEAHAISEVVASAEQNPTASIIMSPVAAVKFSVSKVAITPDATANFPPDMWNGS